MDAPSIAHLNNEKFTATRVVHARPDPDKIIDIPCADAFSIIVQLEDFAEHRLWRGRRLSYSGGYRQGSVSLPFMGDELRCQHRASYDNLRFNIPRQTLDEYQAENRGRKIDGFRYEQGAQDRVLYHLAQAMLPALQNPAMANQLFIDHILLAMCAHSIQHYGRIASTAGKFTTTLTPRQERLAKEMIAGNLGNDLSVERVAQECSLSRSHFSRAFKQATGVAPHTWLLQMRVEKAKELLQAQPQLPLAAIAGQCGFSDQPHLTRVFTRMVGTSPSVWRGRQRGAIVLLS
ncbi:transcriptional regulator, AraC family protein [Pseudomonas sp. CFII64]|uniref:AraC family transcriptional regulator n=1 Tax=Pseudomonas sp. CFII64 TaxID=911242 RepID=UPI0003582AE5|nr:AraC family transcriptional regulator [Pseudomonas sp. CFII64]EPJ80198.1 transcriptional regulator, AraC family protein [Pseudomonas sp. CFII64]